MQRRGFTLIELLVVIAIIGVLSSIVLVSVNTVRIKARDARRIADMRTIQTALEVYYSDNGRYPASQIDAGGGNPNCGGWDCSSMNGSGVFGSVFIPALVPTYLAEVPVDPVNTGSSATPGSFYYRYLRTTSAFGVSTGDCATGIMKYVLSINAFEGGAGTYRNPFFCSSGNGQWFDGRRE